MVSGRRGRDAAEGKRDGMGLPRFLFVFRGRRSLQAAGSRAKASGLLEFWVVLGVVLALIAIVVLVYLRGVAAS